MALNSYFWPTRLLTSAAAASFAFLWVLVAGCADESGNRSAFAPGGSESADTSPSNGDTEGPDTNETEGAQTDAVPPDPDVAPESDTPDSDVSHTADTGEGEPRSDTADGGNGECATNADCDDGNPCTDNICGKLGCAFVHARGACDDGNPCTTGDACVQGKCTGAPLDCDDNDPCTKDSCSGGECVHAPETLDPACGPNIEVSFPARAAVLSGASALQIQGKVSAPSANPVVELRLNGTPVQLSGATPGSFQVAFTAKPGLNILVFEATTAAGNKSKRVQAFSHSQTLHPVNTPAQNATLNNAGGLWLGLPVFDDNDPSDLDDISSVARRVLETLDIASLLPSPLIDSASGIAGFLWCSWSVDVPFLTYKVQQVQVRPTKGGLILSATLSNVVAGVQATEESWTCPDLTGTITATALKISAKMNVSVTQGGLSADVDTVDVTLEGTNIQFTSGIGTLANWILDWFETDLVEILEEQLSAWLPAYMVPVINDVLGELVSYSATVEIPSFLATGDPTALELVVEPAAAGFGALGAAFGLRLGAAAAKKVTFSAPGTFARGTCGGAAPGPGPTGAPIPQTLSCTGHCGGQNPSGACYCDNACAGYGDCCLNVCTVCGFCDAGLDALPWPKGSPLEALVHEDFANQILFAMWWAGGLNLRATDTELAQFRTTAGLSGVTIDLMPHMAPIATTCTPGGQLELQLGDVWIDTTFEFAGVAVAVTAWASARIRVELASEPPTTGKVHGLGLKLVDVPQFDYELESVDGLGPGGQTVISSLLGEELIQFLIQDYLAGAVAAFPLPAIDLGGLVPGVPQGTTILFDPTQVSRGAGWLLVGGQVLEAKP